MPHPVLMRKLRGGGKKFVPYVLEGWDGVYETFNDYSEGAVTTGSGLGYGFGWLDDPVVDVNAASGPMALSYVDSTEGYVDGTSIAGVTPTGGNFAGPWEVD